jgi:hypothetical protein
MLQIYFGFALFVASSLTAAAQQSALDCAVAARDELQQSIVGIARTDGN